MFTHATVLNLPHRQNTDTCEYPIEQLLWRMDMARKSREGSRVRLAEPAEAVEIGLDFRPRLKADGFSVDEERKRAYAPRPSGIFRRPSDDTTRARRSQQCRLLESRRKTTTVSAPETPDKEAPRRRQRKSGSTQGTKEVGHYPAARQAGDQSRPRSGRAPAEQR